MEAEPLFTDTDGEESCVNQPVQPAIQIQIALTRQRIK
jgi:hypothetical protein